MAVNWLTVWPNNHQNQSGPTKKVGSDVHENAALEPTFLRHKGMFA